MAGINSTLDRSVVGEIEKLDAGESGAMHYLPRQSGRGCEMDAAAGH